ncbi:MAG: phosphotransferase [Acidimicrobiales bacterium]|nr:phosphotransferase [Acidimicrobiales bacterium]
MGEQLPVTPDDIDAAWLTDALADRHPGVSVASVEVLERHEVTNHHARLRVGYQHAAGAPDTMFCKLPPLDPARRDSINSSGMGRREALFYRELAPRLDLRVPEAHVALHDERDGTFVLLLEDLDARGCTVSNGPMGPPVDAAAVLLESLARMHVRFEDPARRDAEAAWVPTIRSTGDYGARLLQLGLDHHRDKLSDSFAAIARLYIDHTAVLQEAWRAGPQTVIHGDTHVGNLFFDHGSIGLLDWGIINVSTPMREVSYFLTMSLTVADRRVHDAELLRHYLSVREAEGGSPISFDDAWRAHRLHVAYTVPASCQVVTFPADASDRRKVFAAAFLERAEAAIADLDALAALREATGL